MRISDWSSDVCSSDLVGGGILGGFAGLSGPLPVLWLQLRGGPSLEQRAVYQPFNLIVLAIAGAGMASAGKIDGGILQAMLLAAPAPALGAWLGARLYRGASEIRRASCGGRGWKSVWTSGGAVS